MTSQDYEKFAELVAKGYNRASMSARSGQTNGVAMASQMDFVMEDMIAIFKADNPRFNRDKFESRVIELAEEM